MSDSDLYAIIADQSETIDQLRADLSEAERNVSQLEYLSGGENTYYGGVYDRIRAAWDAWALAELGTSTPSQLDLAGRSELAELWEAVR